MSLANGSLDGEDLDYMLNDSCSQTSYSQLDFDAILQPLSNSQQEREADLDKKEEALNERLVGGLGERQLSDESRSKRGRQTWIKRRAPGLPVLVPGAPLRFSSLCLERDLGWRGRPRLLAAGFSPQLLDRMLGDSLLFVRYLAPEVGQTNLIASEEEFQEVADYLFYLASLAEEPLVFSVLQKALFDLIKNCGFDWKLTFDHLFTCLLNLGVSENAVLNPDFYEFNKISEVPLLPSFYTQSISPKTIGEETRLRLIENSLSMVCELVSLPWRHLLGPCTPGRESCLQATLHLLAMLGQDTRVIDQPAINRNIQCILFTVLNHIDEDQRLDAAELLSTGFMPGVLLPSICLPWSYSSLPPYWGEGGLNHPHNMLCVAMLLPCKGLKQLLAYLCIQLILGIQNIDLPSHLTLTDVKVLMEENSSCTLLTELTETGYYPVFCLLSLVDILICTLHTSRPSTEDQSTMKAIIEEVQAIYRRTPKTDPLDLDPVAVSEVAIDFVTRWNLELAAVTEDDEGQFQVS